MPEVSSPLRAKPLHQRLVRLCLPMVAVLAIGTAGFMIIEGWPLEHSIYFTIITFTTVGYSDYGLSLAGERFASIMILAGFGTFTYVLGQVVQIIVERQLDWERLMHRKTSQLHDHYIVVGFGRIGQTVCQRLHDDGIPFVVVDRDRDLVEQAVRSNYVGILADATHDSVLHDCGIANARGLACLTTSDANNIVITLSARALRPDLHIISRAEGTDHARKLKRAGADRVISPEQSGANAIANSILRPHTYDFLDQTASAESQVEFSKLPIRAGSALDGRAIAQMPVCAASPIVIVALEHKDGSTRISPPASQVLHAGDTLIIAGHPGAVVSFCADAA